jgi:hypothetical protein
MDNLISALIQAVQAYGTTGTAAKKPFDNDTNAGWGANQYTQSIFSTNKFTYAKKVEANDGITLAGSNGKNLSLDSILGFSEMTLQTAAGKTGDATSDVAPADLKSLLGVTTSVANAIDADANGKVTKTELSSYYLLADKLDGTLDGKVRSKGINAVKTLANGTDAEKADLKNQLYGVQQQILTAAPNANTAVLELGNEEVDGSEGSYDSDDIVTRGANAGEQVAKMTNDPNYKYSTVTFLQQDEAGELSIESGLAFATSLLGANKVSRATCKISAPDLNNDNFISADEVLATLMTQDANGDGKINYTERVAFEANLKSGDVTAEDVEDNWDANDLESLAEDFEMPDKEDGTNITAQNSGNFADIIKQLLASFGIRF